MPSDLHNSTIANGSFFTIRRRFCLRGAFLPSAVATVHASWTYLCLPLCPISLLYYSGGVACKWLQTAQQKLSIIFTLHSNTHTLWTCCSNYSLYVTMVNRKNMAVIEAKQKRNFGARVVMWQ